MSKMWFTLGYKKEGLFAEIKTCEGLKHIQQVAYSTYGDTLTQVCFSCWRVRTTKQRKEVLKDE